jgi:glyoxylase-like metal-dependent hydrolase (beta-lactamase superfamily II)
VAVIRRPFKGAGGRRATQPHRRGAMMVRLSLTFEQHRGLLVALKHRLLASAAAVLVCSPAVAQEQDFSQVKIETIPLASNLFMLLGSGGNIALSTGPNGSVLVDTQFAPLNEKILAAVRAAGGSDVKFVVNTHWHGDHSGGNEPLGKAGAVIIAHNNVRTRMSTEQVMAAFNQTIPPSPAAALPMLTFPDRATFHWNGNTVNVFHVENAHTDGDSIVQFVNLNIIHTGDTYMKDTYPFIDRSSQGSIDGFIKASEIVLARSDASTKIIPGHGALANRADYQRFHDMLVKVRGNIKTLLDAGKSADEVVAAKPTAEFDSVWGVGFMMPETFVRFAYDSLK